VQIIVFWTLFIFIGINEGYVFFVCFFFFLLTIDTLHSKTGVMVGWLINECIVGWEYKCSLFDTFILSFFQCSFMSLSIVSFLSDSSYSNDWQSSELSGFFLYKKKINVDISWFIFILFDLLFISTSGSIFINSFKMSIDNLVLFFYNPSRNILVNNK